MVPGAWPAQHGDIDCGRPPAHHSRATSVGSPEKNTTWKSTSKRGPPQKHIIIIIIIILILILILIIITRLPWIPPEKVFKDVLGMFEGPNTSRKVFGSLGHHHWSVLPASSSISSLQNQTLSNTTHHPSTPHPTPQNSSLSTPKKIRYPINIQKRNTPKTLTQQNKRNVYILRMISVCVFLCFSPFCFEKP